ncbi:MAG: MFS transporter, partial [Actinomycetota bacterium]
MIPLGDDTSEGKVVATAGLVVAMLVMQACVRIMLAVKSAALPGVLHGKDLLNGNGLSQAGGALFQVLGAGVAFGAGGALPSWTIVIVGGIALVVSSFVAMRIQRMEITRHVTSWAEEAKRVVKDIVNGVREVASRPAAALGLSAFQMLRYQFWGFALGVFALYARSLVETGDVDTIALGIVGGGGFAGGVLGMILAERWKDRVPPIRLLLGSMALLGGSALVLGFWVGLGGFSLLLFCGFFAFFLGKISADTILQQAISDDFRGRAFALFDIAYNVGFIVPAVILVLVWNDDRASVVLVASGAVFLALTALVARWARKIRDELAPQDDLVAGAPEAG